MDMYCDIGNAVHMAIQRWMGKRSALYGNWGCPKCDAYWNPRFKEWCTKASTKDTLGPVECFCGLNKDYVEYKFVDTDTGMRGHADGFLPLNDAQDEFCLLEFKTAGQFVLRKMKEPHLAHIVQTQIYASLAERRGMKIKKLAIIYICRDNPQTIKRFMLDPDPRYLKRVVQLKFDADDWLENALEKNVEDWPDGICSTMKDGEKVYCPYRYNCFASNPTKIVDKLISSYKEKHGG